MSIKRIISLRLCLSLGAAVAVASVLMTHRGGPAPNLEGPGVVYVYFPSECAVAGVAKDCREVPRAGRPSFESMAACSAHADRELKAAHNPRLLASCMKTREG